MTPHHLRAEAKMLEDANDGEISTTSALLTGAADVIEEMAAALKLTQGAMGMHGPCKHNSCSRCTKAWNAVESVLRKHAAALAASEAK